VRDRSFHPGNSDRRSVALLRQQERTSRPQYLYSDYTSQASHEGRWKCALDAIRHLDLRALTASGRIAAADRISARSRLRWISQPRALHTRPRREHVRSRTHAAGDFAHGDSTNQESIRNQRSVTAPRHRLRAHQNNTLSSRKLQATAQVLTELGSLHVVGVAPEAGVTPSRVD